MPSLAFQRVHLHSKSVEDPHLGEVELKYNITIIIIMSKTSLILQYLDVGVSIKGSKDGIKAAKQELDKLLSGVKTKDYTVKQPGMPAYFKHESAGQSQLVTVENRCQVGDIVIINKLCIVSDSVIGEYRKKHVPGGCKRDY